MQRSNHLSISRYKGDPFEIGLSIGTKIGQRFEKNIIFFIDTIDKQYGLDLKKLKLNSLKLFNILPLHFQKELEGISRGAHCTLQKIAEWVFCDRFIKDCCSSFITLIDGIPWIGRNNDYLFPCQWGHVIIRNITNKIPTMLFGLEGDVFSGTGVNKEKLWLHYNWLPSWGKKNTTISDLPPYVLLREALETCSSIADVKSMLSKENYDRCFVLFSVDGKTNDFSVFECSNFDFKEKELISNSVAATNHYCVLEPPKSVNYAPSTNSINRLSHMEKLLSEIKFQSLPEDIIKILSNPKIEQHNNNYSGTVYSNVACPSKNIIWYAFNGFPASSNSNWQKIGWPW